MVFNIFLFQVLWHMKKTTIKYYLMAMKTEICISWVFQGNYGFTFEAVFLHPNFQRALYLWEKIWFRLQQQSLRNQGRGSSLLFIFTQDLEGSPSSILKVAPNFQSFLDVAPSPTFPHLNPIFLFFASRPLKSVPWFGAYVTSC